MHTEQVSWIPLIPLVPLIGFLINGAISLALRDRRRGPADSTLSLGARGLVSLVGCAAPIVALCLSIAAFSKVAAFEGANLHLQTRLLPWIEAGWFKAPLHFQVDRLSAVMCLVVTGVGSLIHIYSTAYMDHESPGGFARYFAYLNLFTFSMLVLVTGGNLLLMFLGWEGVGLCSYLLIGFWYDDLANARAGKKAFVVNRIGDAGFILGMLLLACAIGPQDAPSLGWVDPTIGEGEAQALVNDVEADGPLAFHVVNNAAPHLKVGSFPEPTATASAAPQPLAGFEGRSILAAAALLLFVGACGKSAQIPLYVWLPDAMAGPTPVSALIHAATMVTAGVYMVARLNGLFLNAPGALEVVAMVGALTAVFAASIALCQNDLKKVLAYSTVSQLGYMFLGVGAAAFGAGIFHLVTHAFFKALLFLSAGAVMHALHGHPDHPHGVGDMRLMGGLLRKTPIVFACFLVGGLALAGVPPFAGFFSKDAILFAAFAKVRFEDGGLVWIMIWVLGVIAAAFTAIYITRLVAMAFLGEPRTGRDKHLIHAHEHAHDPPSAMAFPLVALLALSAIGGFLGIPAAFHLPNWIEGFLGPVFDPGHGAAAAHHDDAHIAAEWQAMVVSVLAAGAGILAGLSYYAVGEKKGPAVFGEGGALHRLQEWVRDKYYIDELYDLVFVQGIGRLSGMLFRRVDVAVIDKGAVEGVGSATRALSEVVRSVQTGFLSRYAVYFTIGVIVILVVVFAQERAVW